MKIIKLGTDTNKYFDLLELNDIIWHQPYGSKSAKMLLYVSNKDSKELTLNRLLGHSNFPRAVRSNGDVTVDLATSAVRLKPKVFEDVKHALDYIDYELGRKANLKLSPVDTQQKILDLLNEAKVSAILSKFSRGSLNLTYVVQKRIGVFLFSSNWKKKSGHIELLSGVKDSDLAGVLMEKGMTSDKFELRVLDYVTMYERRDQLTKEMSFVLKRNNGY